MRTKLNYETAQTIRERAGDGEMQKILAYEYGVTKSTISMIITGKIWQCPSNIPDTHQVSSISSPPPPPCLF